MTAEQEYFKDLEKKCSNFFFALPAYESVLHSKLRLEEWKLTAAVHFVSMIRDAAIEAGKREKK